MNVLYSVDSSVVLKWMKEEESDILLNDLHKGYTCTYVTILFFNYYNYTLYIDDRKNELWSAVVRRQFLIQLKAKYAGNILVCIVMLCYVLFSRWSKNSKTAIITDY